MKYSEQSGFSSILIIIIVVVVAAGAFSVFIGFDFLSGSDDVASGEAVALVDKSDPDWLIGHCMSEIVKLPEASFSYEDKDTPYISSPTTFISKLLPEDKRYDAETCNVAYNYDSTEAYASYGLEYTADINVVNAFAERIASDYSSQIDSSWSLFSQLSDEEAGRPGYASKALPLVFTRENAQLGTVEYAEVFLGIPLYVKFTAYEK